MQNSRLLWTLGLSSAVFAGGCASQVPHVQHRQTHNYADVSEPIKETKNETNNLTIETPQRTNTLNRMEGRLETLTTSAYDIQRWNINDTTQAVRIQMPLGYTAEVNGKLIEPGNMLPMYFVLEQNRTEQSGNRETEIESSQKYFLVNAKYEGGKVVLNADGKLVETGIVVDRSPLEIKVEKDDTFGIVETRRVLPKKIPVRTVNFGLGTYLQIPMNTQIEGVERLPISIMVGYNPIPRTQTVVTDGAEITQTIIDGTQYVPVMGILKELPVPKPAKPIEVQGLDVVEAPKENSKE